MSSSSEPARLEFPGLLLPGLNGPDGMIRERSWRGGKARRAELAIRVRAAGRVRRLELPAWLVYERRHTGTPMDWANAAASLKHLEDAVVAAGWLPDDSPTHVLGLEVRQVRVPHKPERGSVVTLVPSSSSSCCPTCHRPIVP